MRLPSRPVRILLTGCALILVAASGVRAAAEPGSATPRVEPAEPVAPSAAAGPGEDVPVSSDWTARPWRIRAYRGETDLVPVEPGERPPRLAFADGRVSGSLGCNSFSGGYSLTDAGLTIDPRLAMTMMACEEVLMAQEQAIAGLLAVVTGVRLDAGRLDLLDTNGRVLIQLDPLPERPLLGTTWGLERYNNGKEALVSPLAGTSLTLTLSPGGRLAGSDGCNRYMSGYTLEGARLLIGPIATTRMACRGPEGVAVQAAAYAAALGQVRAYRIEGEQLWLTAEDGTTAASFRALPEPVEGSSPTP